MQSDLFHVERKEYILMSGLLEVGEWEHVALYGVRMPGAQP